MKTVLFCSQEIAQKRPAWEGWVVISITSPDAYPANLHDGWERVLRIEFDDITKPEIPFAIFTDQQARDVIEFVAQCSKSGVEGILVHCLIGVSRSAAIAKWIAGNYQLPFPANYDRYNMHVYQVLREEHMLAGF